MLGRVVHYKARLIAQGYSQVEGVDYFDTYTPVAKLQSIQMILVLTACLNLEIHQIDIKGAYLNGTLTEDERIYMRQPPGFPLPNATGKVLCLCKMIYGLKQSGCRWYKAFTAICWETLRLKQCSVDQAVFYRQEGKDIIVIAVHIDDCTIAVTTMWLIAEVKEKIGTRVEVIDLGPIHWLLGIKVTWDCQKRILSLSQCAYIESIIRHFHLDDLKPISTPMDPHVKLSTAQSPTTLEEIAQMHNIKYPEAVGSLMYASQGTCPDITFTVTTLSKFLKNLGMAHWEQCKRVFHYLKGTLDWKLTFGETDRDLTGWVDADGSESKERCAITQYAFLIDGGVVSWSSK